MNSLKRKFTYLFPATLAVVVLLSACSTKKNKLPNRVYHNVTAYYNAYFNGNEAFKEGVAQVNAAHVDNYTRILPVFRLADQTAAQAATPKLDRAIAKASKVINKHSMYFRNMEYNRTVDDAYLLIGKSNFYKREYTIANQSFSFIISRFAKQPIRNDALMWLAWVAIYEGNYNKAESSLDVVASRDSKEELSREVRKKLHMVYAELYIKQNKLNQAANHLVNAINAGPGKKERTRLTYILAQVYQELGKMDQAADMYRKVLKMNPSYEMAFHAKINMARCYNETMAAKYDIEKLLLGMLKDVKNKEYLDEIYFSLAELSLKKNKRNQAKDYLKLSVEKSETNQMQKALSSLKIAELCFEDQEYTVSQAYFDTTIAFLPKDYPNYASIADKQAILSELVKNLVIIQTEDSLQRLAGMSEAQRNAMIDKIINDIIRQEQQKMIEEAERMQQLNMMQQDRQQKSVTQAAGQWYFYNTSALSFGFTEFAKKWGKRKLEDNWRLSNKQASAFEADGGIETGEGAEDGAPGTDGGAPNPKDRKTYLQNIPLTKDQMTASYKKLSKALYSAGDIYKNQLSENYKAIDYFSRYEKDFNEGDLLPAVYYQMFRIYTDLSFQDKANHYKNLLSSRFGETDYSRLAQDPEYYKTAKGEKARAEALYTEAFTAYNQNQFTIVNSKCSEALKQFKNVETLARFAYLDALTVGKTKTRDDFKAAIEKVITNYPKTEAAVSAQNILDYLNGSGIFAETAVKKEGASEPEKGEAGNTKGPAYVFDAGTIHLCVAVVNVKNVTVSDLKNVFSDHNSEYFGPDKLTVSSIYLDNQRQIITISSFKNKDRGLAYINSFKVNGILSNNLEKAIAKTFIMSVNNYSTFLKLKDVVEYEEFYNKNYLQN